MISFFEKYRPELVRLCEAYQVERLYAFGSVLTKRFKKESDIDFIVAFEDIPVMERGNNYFPLLWDLEKLLGRKVDLIVEGPIRNPVFREEIEQTKRLIYHGKKGEKMAV